MYLWNILQKNEDELVTKVYNAQKLFPVKDDFFFQIKEDMDDLGLDLEEEAIKNMKKVKFKNLVNGKIRDAAQSYLIQKKENLSKLKNISCRFQLKEYLTTNRLSTSEKQLLFKLRTRMIPVKCNFPSMYKDNLFCQLCNTDTNESQEHVYICPSLVTHSNDLVRYTDIYDENLEKQITAVKLWSMLLKTRTIKLDERNLLFKEARCT